MQLLALLLLCLSAASTANKTCLLQCEGFGENQNVCVTPSMRCDDHPDCFYGEDEEECDCGYICKSDRKCLEEDQRCDGHLDCFDKSDEEGCLKKDYRNAHPSLPEEKLCLKPCEPHGSCSFMANGMAVCNCRSGYSDKFCRTPPPTQNGSAKSENFNCGDKIIESQSFCDGIVDCSDKSDETNCTLEDYGAAKPHLFKSPHLLCLMPCSLGRCRFDRNDRARCVCPPGYSGKLCEQISTTYPSSATPITAIPSTATPTTATPSTATPSTATPSTATPSTATPTTAVPTTSTASPASLPTEASEHAASEQTSGDSSLTESHDIGHRTKDIVSDGSAADRNSKNGFIPFVLLIIAPLVVVASCAFFLWILLVKPWVSRSRRRLNETNQQLKSASFNESR